jgi:ribosome-binding protein aMBF1 (putative translation factor)
MKVCEICGAKQEEETKEHEEFESVILHVCESCREDRRWSHYEDWTF